MVWRWCSRRIWNAGEGRRGRGIKQGHRIGKEATRCGPTVRRAQAFQGDLADVPNDEHRPR